MRHLGWSRRRVAAQHRALAHSCRRLAYQLQARSWAGEPADDAQIASLARAAMYLDRVAHPPAGRPFWSPLLVAGVVASLLHIVVAGAILAMVADPSRPAVVVAAVVAGLVAGEVYLRVHATLAIRAAGRDRPVPLAYGEPALATSTIRLEALARWLDRSGDQPRRDAAEDLRAAAYWLARADTRARRS
jgi:hypothetical protein